jgi:hypothetical protein
MRPVAGAVPAQEKLTSIGTSHKFSAHRQIVTQRSQCTGKNRQLSLMATLPVNPHGTLHHIKVGNIQPTEFSYIGCNCP